MHACMHTYIHTYIHTYRIEQTQAYINRHGHEQKESKADGYRLRHKIRKSQDTNTNTGADTDTDTNSDRHNIHSTNSEIQVLA